MKPLVGSKNTFEAAFLAGTVCNLVTNPLSVMRSRMLLTDGTAAVCSSSKSSKYSSVTKTFAHIAKSEGFRGFYKVRHFRLFLICCKSPTVFRFLKGLVPNLINVSHGAIQFVLYNELKKKIGKKNLVRLELQSVKL